MGWRAADAHPLPEVDKSRERVDLQLFHDPGTVDFDGFLRYPQIGGDLLVEPARNDVLKYFALPRG
jgi:hypothetical protein